jgi:hypothetical protein
VGAAAGGLTAVRGSPLCSSMPLFITLRVESGEYFVAMSFAVSIRALAVSSNRKGLGFAPQTASVAARAICKTENLHYCDEYNTYLS